VKPKARPPQSADVALLDVNVLLALFDPMHLHHALVRQWFAEGTSRIATCPLTELGFVRIASHPRYPNPMDTSAQALELLRALHAEARHAFWPDALSLTDDGFKLHPFQSHKETTDRYLLRLAIHQGGRLLTMDAGIKPADDAERAALCLLAA
jgi:hypothetical protein